MQKLRWTAAVILLLCLTLSTPVRAAAPVLLTESAPAQRKRLVFLVDRTGEEVYREAAQLLAEKAETLSKGTLTVELRFTDQVVADFNAGKGQIAFVDNREGGNITGPFSALSDPMRYTGYRQFTLGLNSAAMLGAVNENLEHRSRALMLAAFYQGSSQLVSNQPLTGGRIPVRDVGEEDWGGQAAANGAALLDDSSIDELLEEYGMDPRVIHDTQQRLMQLTMGEVVVAEVDPLELAEINLSPGQLQLIISNHSINPCWLAFDRSNWNRLADSQRAVLEEAVAYLFPVIDRHFLDLDQQGRETAQDRGFSIVDGFEGLRRTREALDAEGLTELPGKELVDILMSMA